MDGKAFSFCLSKDIEIPVRVKICSLEGLRSAVQYSEVMEQPQKVPPSMGANSDLMVTVQLFAESKPLTIPVSTLYKPFKSARKWNEWLVLPIKFSQLPLSSQLAITIWDFGGVAFGGTTIKLFDLKDCTLKRGRQKLKVWVNREADGLNNSSTDSTIVFEKEMDRLEKLIKKHEAGDLVQVDWLDNLAFRQIERINKISSQSQYRSQTDPNEQHHLFIEFVQFDFPVVYSDLEYPLASPTATPLVTALSNSEVLVSKQSQKSSSDGHLIIVSDPEQARENPIESKYRRLIRSHKSGPLDKELKPNAKIRDELNYIISFSPVQELTDDEKNLLWKFRYYLTRHKRALTKFLKAITWEDPVEAKQAVEMLPQWAEIDVDDALELLGPSIPDPTVRQYAVNRLRKASDQELELYLLQLVEALKFEVRSLQKRNNSVSSRRSSTTTTAEGIKGNSMNKSFLARFLIGRAVRNPILGNYFYWYLAVEAQEKGPNTNIFQPVLSQFLKSLENQPRGHEQAAVLKAQVKFINKLLELSNAVKLSKESRPKKVEHLRNYLADPKNGLVSFAPIPLPVDPTITIVGCVAEDCNVFKSSLFPLKITFKTSIGGTYPIIFKSGDDLRQDQLVIQIINLMDQLLRNENLDLKLTPYRILATGTKDGALQFIPNQTLAHVLTEYHGILPYLRQHNPDSESNNHLGVKPEAMDTFVRSCAGYCVITYILGVGDRHLDNLLICPDGHFFHADYGYILGRDPKPFPPMMKLPIQIIEGMGGASSENYENFLKYCFTAYTTLRKSANLILNLFALMTQSSIPDIMFERDKAVLKVKEKFCLEMSEEEAMAHFQNLINDSVNAFLPMVIDRLHNFAQYWRS